MYAGDFFLIAPNCEVRWKLCKLVEDWLDKYELDIGNTRHPVSIFKSEPQQSFRFQEPYNPYDWTSFIFSQNLVIKKNLPTMPKTNPL